MSEPRDKQRELPEGMFLADDEELPAVGIDRHRPDDEVYQHVPEDRAEWAKYEMAEDGMPQPTVPTAMPFAPPLHPDTLCCIADTRKFCLRGKWGQVVVEFEPEEVERAENGMYRVSRKVLTQALMKGFSNQPASAWEREKRTNDHLAHVLGRTYRQDYMWHEVEPIRPQCKHFARQATDFQDLTDHMFVSRLCTARRDSGGEFLGLRDTQMFACDMRDPYDQKGIERLEKFDQNKIVLGEERHERDGSRFDVDAALEQAIEEADGNTIGTASNIFRKG